MVILRFSFNPIIFFNGIQPFFSPKLVTENTKSGIILNQA